MPRFDICPLSDRKTLPRLRAHFRKCFSESYGDILSAPDLAALIAELESADIGGMVPGSDETTLIAFVDGHIAGTAIHATRGKTTYLWGFYLRPSHQRQQIGTHLMRETLHSLTNDAVVELTVVREGQAAVGFYQAMGFDSVNETTFQMTERHIAQAQVMKAKAGVILGRIQKRLGHS